MTDKQFIEFLIKEAASQIDKTTWSLAEADTKATWGFVKSLAESHLKGDCYNG